MLEIGSGWQPLIPLLFSLAGAERVYITDLRRLCVPATVQAAFRRLKENGSLIVESLGISSDALEKQLTWDARYSMDEHLERLNLKYIAPCDCRSINLPDRSLDVVISRAVLEHIPETVLSGIFPGPSVC